MIVKPGCGLLDYRYTLSTLVHMTPDDYFCSLTTEMCSSMYMYNLQNCHDIIIQTIHAPHPQVESHNLSYMLSLINNE